MQRSKDMSNKKPILFSAPMVTAILDGRKTQTRRVIKKPPLTLKYAGVVSLSTCKADEGKHAFMDKIPLANKIMRIKSPYGAAGTRLWVRETWTISQKTKDGYMVNYREDWDKGPGLAFSKVVKRADMTEAQIKQAERFFNKPVAWHPSIHMPRWASRLTLLVANVRVERLNDISGQDAKAEGCPPYIGVTLNGPSMGNDTYTWFAELWDSINAARGFGWAENPWVWVVDFIREGN